MTNQPMIWAAVVVAMLAVPGALSTPKADEDREALYAGSSLVIPPPDTALPDCDMEPGPNLGGVLFCNIIQGSIVKITINDEVFETPDARITCLASGGPVSHQVIKDAAPTATFEIPDKCIAHPDDKGDTTRIGVFMETGAFSGAVRLIYQ